VLGAIFGALGGAIGARAYLEKPVDLPIGRRAA
jgi:hypothetical protein